ncbi:coatomer subunit beta [Nematocida parisii]|nr:coatomer subunit beta [Nematocida parisii]KAI5126461.1 coatomer subunit beta [Nematocida parisii]KAI5140714.1 coatomer subunit beta [Nematocida parisii]KAI5156033.1 coatomer subunit beta [Nematocida parisii]
MSATCARTLYVSRDLHKIKSKDNLKAILTRGTDESKIEALWHIVKETAMGINHENLLLTLTMAIPSTKSKRLIMLFYLYMESINIEDSEGNIRDEILMICNMIRGHLAHPNEHIRARAIRTVSKFRSAAIFDILKLPFIENLSYSNPIVRASMYIALRDLLSSKELSGIFSDTIPMLVDQILKERDSICLAEGYKTIEQVNKEDTKHIYEKLKESAHEGLQECFLESAEREGDLDQIVEIFKRASSRGIEVHAAVALVKNGNSEMVKMGVDKLLDMSNEYLDVESKSKIIRACRGALKRGQYTFENMSMKIVQMITPAVAKIKMELAKEIFQFTLDVLAIAEAKDLFAFLCQGLTDTPEKDLRDSSSAQDKIFFMQALKELMMKYKICTPELIERISGLVSVGIPELALEAVNFIDSFITLLPKNMEETLTLVIDKLPGIKYGKILRRVFTLISTHADGEKAHEAVLKLLYALASDDKGLLPGLKDTKKLDISKIFPGVPIAIFLLDMAQRAPDMKEEKRKEFTADIMTAALKTYAAGHKTQNIDEASRVALLRLVSLLENNENTHILDKSRQVTGSNDAKGLEQKNNRRLAGGVPCKQNLFIRPVFPLIVEQTSPCELSTVQKFIEKSTPLSLSKLKNIFQLTSAIDPLYCECKINTSRTEITLDILLVNQTDMLLESVEFDIVSSPNIKMASIIRLDKLRPHMVCTLEATLIMEESDTGYIGGVITAGKVGRDNYFIQNLQEIKFNLADMLEKKKIDGEEFRDRWPSLVWENLYTITLNTSKITPGHVIKTVSKAINGTVVETRAKIGDTISDKDEIERPDILVKNMYTRTAQGTGIYVNAAITTEGQELAATFRIRGSNARVVKSLCQLISRHVKTLAE